MNKLRYVDEILAAIDKAEGEEKEKLLKEWGSQHPINMILSMNFNDNVVLNLPEGVPPYKQDLTQHPDTFQTTLAHEIKRLMGILKGRSEHIPAVRRESMFIQMLEGIPPKEAEVLIFAKDKALIELYPTITFDFVNKEFPAFCVKRQPGENKI